MNRIKTMEPALQSLTPAEMSATLPIIRVRRAYRWLSNNFRQRLRETSSGALA